MNRLKRVSTRQPSPRWLFAATAVLCTLGVSMTIPNPISGGREHSMDVEIKIEYRGGAERTIEISLTNKASKSFECFEASLPWRYAHCLTLVLVGQDHRRTQLPYAGPKLIDDPSAAVVQVQTNETLKGTISLKERFPDIDQAINEHGIDVFWAYQPKSLSDRSFKRVGGWFEIPKQPK